MRYSKRVHLILGDGDVHDHHTFTGKPESSRCGGETFRHNDSRFFILDAIAEKTEQEDKRAAFDADAEDHYARIVATGKTIPWQEMRGYLEERLAGKKTKHPVARKLAC